MVSVQRNTVDSVSRKYAPPPFATLALVQTTGGGAYTRDATRLRPPSIEGGLMREGGHICGTLRYMVLDSMLYDLTTNNLLYVDPMKGLYGIPHCHLLPTAHMEYGWFSW